MDVRDSSGSQVIANIMAKKQSLIEKESRTEVARNRQQAEEAEIEASREVALKQQSAKQAVGEREAEADKKIGMAKAQSQAEIAESLKATREKEMEVERIKAVRSAEIAKEATIVNAEADKRAKVLEWEANKESALLEAAAKLELKTKEAEGIKVEGLAKADAEKEMQLASVKAQITLAEQIGNNQGYQEYLIRIRTVEAQQAIGVEQAKNLGKADIKVIANAGSVDSGVKNVMDLFTPKGGTAVGGALEALANTEAGKQLLEKFVKKEDKPA
jgi:flotillin